MDTKNKIIQKKQKIVAHHSPVQNGALQVCSTNNNFSILTICQKMAKKHERKFLTIQYFRRIIKNIRRYKKIKTKENSAQKIIPIDQIREKGIIKLKNGTYIKIIKIIPINYELKSELEKKTILNSYKTFLKTCNFNLQILIQSKKENLEKQFSILEQEKNQKKTPEEKEIFDNYIEYIKKINFENKSSSKNFYIIIHQEDEISRKNPNYNLETIITESLNEKYFKIKETLSRCGNFVYELEKKETIDILYSFFNTRKSEKGM